MLVGGCVGSTSGGLKVLRITVFGRVLARQLRVSGRSAREVVPLTVNGRLLAPAEVERSAAIGIAWIGAVVLLWTVTTVLSNLEGWESLSIAMSTVSNVGPNFADPAVYAGLGTGAKVGAIVAMVAGRLEILPFLLVFSRRVWR